jgi:hypothetical protein
MKSWHDAAAPLDDATALTSSANVLSTPLIHLLACRFASFHSSALIRNVIMLEGLLDRR